MAELSLEQIEALIERAAQKGAERALQHLGLHDENATSDVRDLRSLLEAWRDVRRTMLRTATTMLTAFLLGALALGAVTKLWRADQ